MIIKEITSKDNNEIKNAIKLKETKFQKAYKMFLVEGFNIVNEAFLWGNVKKLFLTKENLKFFENKNVEKFVISNEIAKKMSSVVTPQNVFAVIEINDSKFDENFNSLILENIQDPGNLGTLIRSAHAFDFKNVILSNDTVSPYSDKVVRSSQGLIFKLNIIQCDLFSFLDKNKLKFEVLMTNLHDDSINMTDLKLKFDNKIALILGNEGKGISNKLLEIEHKNLIIKTNQETESLNVAIAGSILMNHFFNHK